MALPPQSNISRPKIAPVGPPRLLCKVDPLLLLARHDSHLQKSLIEIVRTAPSSQPSPMPRTPCARGREQVLTNPMLSSPYRHGALVKEQKEKVHCTGVLFLNTHCNEAPKRPVESPPNQDAPSFSASVRFCHVIWPVLSCLRAVTTLADISVVGFASRT
jgi:hypothetical protein